MNIALLCVSKAWGGLELNVYRLATRLQARGHRVTLIASPNTPIFQKAIGDGLSVFPIQVGFAYFDPKAARQLAHTLRKCQTDILIFSVAKDNYVAGWAKLFFYRKLRLYYLQQMQLGVPKKGLIQTWLYRNLAGWIAPLQVLAAQVRQKTHMPTERIHVVPLGMDPRPFVQLVSRQAEARTTLQLPADAFVAGIIGRIDPDKGQEYLIRAAALLHQRGHLIHVLLVGAETHGDTRNYPGYLRELTQTLHLSAYVHFREFLEQPEMAFAALDVFVMASLGETYGMVTIEAMAAGLAVIGTDSGGTPELLGNGRYGRLVKPADERELAHALESLLTSPVTRREMGNAAQAHAQRNFDYQQQCEALERILARND